jgi:hypothetical protein
MNALVWGADLLSRHLDTVGDGSGEKDAIGDYSGGAVEFRIENYNPDMDMVLSAFDLYIQGAGRFLPDNYGGAPGLRNGIRIAINRASGYVDLTNGEPMVHTCCLARLFHEVQYNLNDGSRGQAPASNWISATWKFNRHGTPLVLHTGDE